MANAAKPPTGGRDMRFQHRLHGFTQCQIGIANNPGIGGDIAIDAAGEHRGDAGDEFCLTHWLQSFRSCGAMHGTRLDIDRRLDVVAAFQIGQEFIVQIAPARPIPKMVMRINDHLCGVQDFFLPCREPILSHGKVMLHLMLGHGVFLTAWL